MQVELGQLEYLLPRLARMWTHLSRIRGAIGLRGPGETQIETDRRLIRRKISQLKKKLEAVARHRDVIRRGQERRRILSAALIGYTNAGKSSLLCRRPYPNRSVITTGPTLGERSGQMLYFLCDNSLRYTEMPYKWHFF